MKFETNYLYRLAVLSVVVVVNSFIFLFLISTSISAISSISQGFAIEFTPKQELQTHALKKGFDYGVSTLAFAKNPLTKQLSIGWLNVASGTISGKKTRITSGLEFGHETAMSAHFSVGTVAGVSTKDMFFQRILQVSIILFILGIVFYASYTNLPKIRKSKLKKMWESYFYKKP